VVRRTTHGTYELRDGTGELFGQHYAPSQLKLVSDDFDETETFEVKETIDHKLDDQDSEKIVYIMSNRRTIQTRNGIHWNQKAFLLNVNALKTTGKTQCLQGQISTQKIGQGDDKSHAAPSRGTKCKRAH